MTGEDHVPGYRVGLWGSFVVRPLTLTIDAFWARNRVESLETMPDAAGKPEFGTRIGFRLGW